MIIQRWGLGIEDLDSGLESTGYEPHYNSIQFNTFHIESYVLCRGCVYPLIMHIYPNCINSTPPKWKWAHRDRVASSVRYSYFQTNYKIIDWWGSLGGTVAEWLRGRRWTPVWKVPGSNPTPTICVFSFEQENWLQLLHSTQVRRVPGRLVALFCPRKKKQICKFA